MSNNNILTAHVTITGTRPLLWHHFGPDAIPPEGRQQREGVAGNNPKEWKWSVLATKNGQHYLEPSQVFAAIPAGARYTPRRRGTLQP
jgi:hypothetical protein